MALIKKLLGLITYALNSELFGADFSLLQPLISSCQVLGQQDFILANFPSLEKLVHFKLLLT
jgi:hypothetical protein